jgi:crotonobetainyl-CoA:carnitine CoA-transferase CaiB-like acyl-CoA transferase
MDAVPGLGEHTDSVLSNLGFSTDQITRFRAEGVV